MKLVTYKELHSILRRKEDHVIRVLNRNARRSSLHLSPSEKTLRNQKIAAQNDALNILLKEIRDIKEIAFLESSDCSVRRFYLVTPKELNRLKKDSLIFNMHYDGKLCKIGFTMNSIFSRKNYHIYVPSIEKVLQKNPIK